MCSRRRGCGASAAFGPACDVVPEPFGDWSLLCIISLVLYAAAGIHGAGGVDFYLRYTLKSICSFHCSGYGYGSDNGSRACDSVEQFVDLKHALGATLKL